MLKTETEEQYWFRIGNKRATMAPEQLVFENAQELAFDYLITLPGHGVDVVRAFPFKRPYPKIDPLGLKWAHRLIATQRDARSGEPELSDSEDDRAGVIPGPLSVAAKIGAALDERLLLDVIVAARPDVAPQIAELKHRLKKLDKKTKEGARRLRNS